MISYSVLARLAVRALQHGAVHCDGMPNVLEWDVGAWCDTPVSRTLHARDYERGVMRRVKWADSPKTLTLHLSGLPCRRCSRCLIVRAREWRVRASTELLTWERTWFVTLTLRPEVAFRVHMEALSGQNKRGYADSDFDEAEEFRLKAIAGGKLVTKWLKRVRKPLDGEPPVRLRYIAATEAHKSGVPHWHLLVHDVAGNLTKRRIQSRWTEGFSQAKLVENNSGSAHYVTKYLAKSFLTRVRASVGYGLNNRPSDIAALYAALEGVLASPADGPHDVREADEWGNAPL